MTAFASVAKRLHTAVNKIARGDALTILASATKTATGNSGWISVEDYVSLSLTLDVTAHGGTTPTLDVSVETAEDSSGTRGRSVAAFSQVTTTNGTQRKSFGPLDRYVRVVWTIAGTNPTYTFSISGDAK